jgi:hypothetical protein
MWSLKSADGMTVAQAPVAAKKTAAAALRDARRYVRMTIMRDPRCLGEKDCGWRLLN